MEENYGYVPQMQWYDESRNPYIGTAVQEDIQAPVQEPEYPDYDFSSVRTAGGDRVNSEYLNYIYRKLLNAGYDERQASMLLGQIAEKSGGDPFAVDDTGTYQGLLQWGPEGYQINTFYDDDPYKEINRQLKYLLGSTDTESIDTTDYTEATAQEPLNSFSAGGQIYNIVKPKVANTFEDGGDTKDEEEYFDVLPATAVEATLPDIHTQHGKDIATRMAERVASGQMNITDVPRSYQSYVEGEARGAMPVRRAINEAAPVVATGLAATAAAPYAIAGLATGSLGSAAAKGLQWVGEKSMPSALLNNIGLSSVAPYADAAAMSVWSAGAGQAAYNAAKDHRPIDAVGYGAMAALPYMPLAGRAMRGIRNFNDQFKVGADDLYGAIEPVLQQGSTTSPALTSAQIEGIMPTVVTPSTATIPYTVEDLGGGYMLKSLMRGNPLEKQISKQGTVSVNNVKALMNKGSKVEQAVVDKVLASEEFAGKKAIDYNKFRKAVQDELIIYERTPDTRWANYGMDRIGVSDTGVNLYDYTTPESQKAFDKWIKDKGYTYDVLDNVNVDAAQGYIKPDGTRISLDDAVVEYNLEHRNAQTFTFSSPRIPLGSNKHYSENTLGHSRTYTTVDEPDVLHVMESQSDWAQEGRVAKNAAYVKDRMAKHPGTESDPDSWLSYAKERIKTREGEIESFKKMLETGVSENGEKLEPYAIKQVKDELLPAAERRLAEAKSRFYGPTPQEVYLSDNFTSRQIQENLRYAAEKGQTKMRYPTRETAAKIEGYSKSRAGAFELEPELREKYDAFMASRQQKVNDIIRKSVPEGYIDDYLLRWEEIPDEAIEVMDKAQRADLQRRSKLSWDFDKSDAGAEMKRKINEVYRNYDEQKWLEENVPATYQPQHETILRKYDAFPKQFKKLFKNAEVRTVTDAKGNTWYEVDVPKDYLKQEWEYDLPVEGDMPDTEEGLLTDIYGGEVKGALERMRKIMESPKRKDFEKKLSDEAVSLGFLDPGEELAFARHNPEEPTISVVPEIITKNGNKARGVHKLTENSITVTGETIAKGRATPEHESLHYFRLGNTPTTDHLPTIGNDAYAEAINKRKALSDINSSESQKYAGNPIKRLFAARDATREVNRIEDLFNRSEAFRRFKADKVIDKDLVRQAYSNKATAEGQVKPHEVAVHAASTAQKLGIKEFSDYPGDAKFDELYEKARKLDHYFTFYHHSTPEEKRRLWDLMTFGYLGLAGVGVFAGNNMEQ